MRHIFFAVALSLATIPAFADDAEGGHAEDRAIIADVASRYDLTEALASQLWDWAEVGYKEEKSSGLLQQTLKDAGFAIQTGIAGIPTAFVASYGDSGPVIAIL
ncbi:MAG: amidohydrolase, partial [Parvularculaceae bacterium]